MARTRPYANDVERFAFAAGMITASPSVAQDYLDFDLAADAALERFQRETRIPQFVAETVDSTSYYDAEGGPYVRIHPYVSITSVALSYSFNGASYTAQTLNSNYRTGPNTGPIRWLVFDEWLNAMPAAVQVIGKRGWATDFPADVFQAICGQALVEIQPTIAGAINNGAISWREGDVSETYGNGSMGAFGTSVEGWSRAFNAVIAPEPAGYKQVRTYGAGRI